MVNKYSVKVGADDTILDSRSQDFFGALQGSDLDQKFLVGSGRRVGEYG